MVAHRILPHGVSGPKLFLLTSTLSHSLYTCIVRSRFRVSSPQRKPMRRRYESPGIYSDDDGANSDASSACSERSYGSRNGSVPHYLRQMEDVAEVLNHCASSNWSERKEGLLGLQNLLKSQRILRWAPRRQPDVQEKFCCLWRLYWPQAGFEILGIFFIVFHVMKVISFSKLFSPFSLTAVSFHESCSVTFYSS